MLPSAEPLSDLSLPAVSGAFDFSTSGAGVGVAVADAAGVGLGVA